MVLTIFLIFLGFVLLIKGADWLVTGASNLARQYNVSDLAIGLTIVAFGTSAPELVVNSVASLQGHSDIVFGNVIGSNNFNLFLILGVVGIIFPITVHSNTVWKEIPISFLAILILLFLANDFIFQNPNQVSRLDGVLLLVLFLLFLYYVYRQMNLEDPQPETSEGTLSSAKIWISIVVGLAGLIIGGRLIVDNAIVVATAFGVSEKVIGLTIIAAGTSLPELVTSVVAAFKKNSDIAIGNIIGSNIFNIFLILSVSAFFNPIQYNLSFNTDLYFLASGTIFLFLAMFTGGRKKLDRWEAGVLLIAFISYTTYLIGIEV